MTRRISKFFTVLWAPFFLLACAGTGNVPSAADASPLTLVKAATANPPRSMLYVGNSFMSYNNSLYGMVSLMARGSDNAQAAQYRSTSLTISGSASTGTT